MRPIHSGARKGDPRARLELLELLGLAPHSTPQFCVPVRLSRGAHRFSPTRRGDDTFGHGAGFCDTVISVCCGTASGCRGLATILVFRMYGSACG